MDVCRHRSPSRAGAGWWVPFCVVHLYVQGPTRPLNYRAGGNDSTAHLMSGPQRTMLVAISLFLPPPAPDTASSFMCKDPSYVFHVQTNETVSQTLRLLVRPTCRFTLLYFTPEYFTLRLVLHATLAERPAKVERLQHRVAVAGVAYRRNPLCKCIPHTNTSHVYHDALSYKILAGCGESVRLLDLGYFTFLLFFTFTFTFLSI
jgi:hypothetical protein